MTTPTPTETTPVLPQPPQALRLAFLYPTAVLLAFAIVGPVLQTAVCLAVALAMSVGGVTSRGRLLIAASASAVALILAVAEPYFASYSLLLAAPATLSLLYGCRITAASTAPSTTADATPRPTPSGWMLLLGCFTLLVLGALADAPPLVVAPLLIIGATLVPCAGWVCKMTRTPLTVDSAAITVKAGSVATGHATVSAPALSLMRIGRVSPTTGVFPLTVWLNNDAAVLEVTVRPLLSGPRTVAAAVVLMDPFGLVAIARELRLVSLNVVPRARIVRIAARNLAEGRRTAPEARAGVSGAISTLLAQSEGGEYVSSRMYVPGDSVRRMDWKHTAKMQRFVVRVYSDQPSPDGLLLVNLDVADEDEADRLAYELLSAALTLGRQNLRAALIPYTLDGPPAHPQILGGRRFVAEALRVVREVRVTSRYRRLLDIRSLQAVSGLKLTTAAAGVAPGVTRLLAVEEEALEASIEAHPLACIARSKGRTLSPGWCLAVSNMGYDGEALTTVLGRLKASGTKTLLLDLRKDTRGTPRSKPRTMAAEA